MFVIVVLKYLSGNKSIKSLVPIYDKYVKGSGNNDICVKTGKGWFLKNILSNLKVFSRKVELESLPVLLLKENNCYSKFTLLEMC